MIPDSDFNRGNSLFIQLYSLNMYFYVEANLLRKQLENRLHLDSGLHSYLYPAASALSIFSLVVKSASWSYKNGQWGNGAAVTFNWPNSSSCSADTSVGPVLCPFYVGFILVSSITKPADFYGNMSSR